MAGWPRSTAVWLVLAGLGVAAVVAGGAVALHASRRPDDGAESATLRVFAGIPPVAYLVEHVGGENVHVDILVQPGQDPHIFEPLPRQVVALGKARLFFKVGMPFEDRLVEKIARQHGRMTVVDTAAGVHKRLMTEACGQAEHGTGHDHDEGCGPDPHVWLAPQNLKTMAANVAAALEQADPAHADEFRRNLAALLADLDAVDVRVGRALAPHRGQSFYVFHPAFGYFGDAYGLRQETIETEGRSPTARQLRALVKQARRENVKIIFLQPQLDPRSAGAVANALGGTVAPMDDLAPDVIANLDAIAAKVESALTAAEGKRGQSPFVRSRAPSAAWSRAVPANGDCPLFPPGFSAWLRRRDDVAAGHRPAPGRGRQLVRLDLA
jgi:zinc transport system substrate-binding protein